MGFAGRDFDNHRSLWLQRVYDWEREDPERFKRWQQLARKYVAKGLERKEAGRRAWKEVSEG